MDPAMRQVYNSLYYKRNKVNILKKLTTKVNCEFCGRCVSFANLQKHYVLKICRSTQDKNKYMADRKIDI